FYTTFENYPKVFSPVYINLIKAGEKAGNLDEVTQNITQSLTKEKELKEKLKSALIYPSLLLGISVLVLIFLVTFALPRIANVFLKSGFEPPLFSKIVFSVGLFLGKIWYLVLGGILGLVGLSYYLYQTSLFFRKFFWSIIGEIPVVSGVIKKKAIQRFSSTTSSLIRAGIPITRSLKITAQATGNVQLKNALIRIADEGLSKGLSMGEAFKREPFFPNMVVNLISIAEEAGHLEGVLSTLSDFYRKEVDNSVKRMVSFLEPALLLFIGVVIGTIALAIIVPIYQLTTQF
ncbi:MAG: type II secretion system F family protein, partial [Candidatus Magasanikbacteria bacterium]